MKYDLIIIGAGPAGCSCAISSVRLGLKTLLIDKKDFPREKTCGGLISKKAADFLDRELKINGSWKKNTLKINCLGLGSWENLYFKKYKNILGFSWNRISFDSLLLEQVMREGVDVITGLSNWEILEQNKKNVSLKIKGKKVKASFLIGADGVFSKVKKHIHFQKPPGYKLAFSLQKKVKKIPLPLAPQAFTLFAIPVLGGMGWIIPKKEGYIIGLGGSAIQKKRIMDLFTSFTRNLTPISHVKGAFLPVGGLIRDTGFKRIILAGDAAGLVDPFGGEGIYYSLKSGKIIARTCAGILEPSEIQKLIKREFTREFYHQFFPSLILNTLLGVWKKPLFNGFFLPAWIKIISTIMTCEKPWKKFLPF